MRYDEKTVLMGIGFRRQSEFLNSRVILRYGRWQLGGILQTVVEEKSSMLPELGEVIPTWNFIATCFPLKSENWSIYLTEWKIWF